MRKILLAMPTYWTHPGGAGAEEVFFDHPSPLDTPGTLRRALESLVPLITSPVLVGVVAAATHPELNSRMELHLGELLSSPPLPYRVHLLGPSHVARLREVVQKEGQEEWLPLISLKGYGAVRNLTLVLATLLGADVLVSLDDDEVIEDPDFLRKVTHGLEVLSRRFPVFGLAGPYVNPDGGVEAPEPQAPWALFWPKLRLLNQTLRELSRHPEPWPLTPMALGGNMVLPRALYRSLPFDPWIPRGEDIDYVVNARMWEIPFFFQKDLRVRHLPPPKPHPAWLRLRQDVLRFAYARKKLRQQEAHPGMVKVTPESLMPYPGRFLLEDLEKLVHESHTLLALEYLIQGDPAAAAETLENLRLFKEMMEDPGSGLPNYLAFAERWRQFQGWLSDPRVAVRVRQALWGE